MSDFVSRLERYLAERKEQPAFRQLTPDASTREYFRIQWKGSSAIACVYPEAFIAGEQTYLDVTGLFLAGGLPVAEIFDYDEELGIIVLEDLGDTILRDVLLSSADAERNALINEAIGLIARIQKATQLAYERDSIASRLKFDREKLLWELDFFRTHFFETYLKKSLSKTESAALSTEFDSLAKELEGRAAVLCHRDFHAANLMIDQAGSLRIIDQQDARIGSAAYDLVSFLLDRITVPPSPEWLADKRRLFLGQRTAVGLETLDADEFAEEFRLQAIQRCLKAVGTFSYQSVNRGKTYFVPFIKPMLMVVHRAVGNLDRFPVLHELTSREIERESDDL